MYCNKCGKEIDDEALICPHCGCGTVNYIRDQAKAEARVQVQAAPARKKRSTALLLCIFLVALGRTGFMSARSGRGFFGSLRSAFGALARWLIFAESMITNFQMMQAARSMTSIRMV